MLDGAGHQVALYAAGDRTSGFCLAVQAGGEILHDSTVAAAVAAAGNRSADGAGNGGLELVSAEVGDMDMLIQVIGMDLTVFAHDMDVSVDITGLGSEGEGYCDIIVELHEDAHVVTDIVVAAVDTAAGLFLSPG